MYLKIYLYDNYIQMSHMTYSMNYPNEVCDISQFILIENVRETMFPDDTQECPWITN